MRFSRLFLFSGDYVSSYAKLSARAALTGNYTDSASTVIIMLLSGLSVVFINQLVFFYAKHVFNLVLPISCVVLTFLVCIFRYILSAGLLDVCERECIKKNRNVRRFFKGGLLEFYLFILKFSEFVCFMFPPAVLGFSAFIRFRMSPVYRFSIAVNIAGCAMLALVGICFFLVSVQKYSKAVYFFAGNESVSVTNAIRLSISSTKGLLLKISLFKLSFFPWLISGVLLLPLMFVLPYYEESLIFYCMFSRK